MTDTDIVVAVHKSKLTAVGDAIRTALDVQTLYELDDMPTAIGSISGGGGVTVESLSVTENGTYTAQTGTAYSPVVVNVPSGGGGTNAIYVSQSAPTSGDGNLNDLWIQSDSMSASTLIGQTLTRKYTIDITKAARDTDYTFNYYGARELDFIFDDGNGNDVLLQDIDSNFTFSGSLNKNTLFDKSLSTYTEASGIPATMTVSLTVPAGYALKGFRVGGRNDSWHDFWRSFTVTETFVYNSTDYSRVVLSETDMVYSQWDVGAYVDFTNDMQFPQSASASITRYIKLSTGWETIDSLDRYIEYTL